MVTQLEVGCVPVLEEGVDHAAVDDAEDQPHQHGHNVLGESVNKAILAVDHSAPCQQGAVGCGGVQEHLITWKHTRSDGQPHLD